MMVLWVLLLCFGVSHQAQPESDSWRLETAEMMSRLGMRPDAYYAHNYTQDPKLTKEEVMARVEAYERSQSRYNEVMVRSGVSSVERLAALSEMREAALEGAALLSSDGLFLWETPAQRLAREVALKNANYLLYEVDELEEFEGKSEQEMVLLRARHKASLDDMSGPKVQSRVGEKSWDWTEHASQEDMAVPESSVAMYVGGALGCLVLVLAICWNGRFSMVSFMLLIFSLLTFWWGSKFGEVGALGIIPAMFGYIIGAVFLVGACIVAKLDWLRDVMEEVGRG